MKKLMYIILALCLVLALAACGGGNASSGGTTEGNGIKSDHVHCVCAGKAVGVGAHEECSNKDGWVEVATADALTDAINAATTAKPAYVALTADITVDGYLEIGQNQSAYICLNGKKLNASANVLGSLNIADCTGTGSIVGDKTFTVRTYAGATVNLYAGTVTTTGSKTDTQVVILDGNASEELQLGEAPATFTLYGGKIQAVGKTSIGGHCVYLLAHGTLKMYDGVICDGNVETADNNLRYGGNIFMRGTNCEFWMYGGEVKDGTMHCTAGNNASGGTGGNIGIWAGSLHVLGGTISGGLCHGYGGNIGTNNKPQVIEFKNCVIKDGVAEGNFGGNMYFNNAGEHLIFENVTISGGTAAGCGANIFFNQVKATTITDCTISGGIISGNASGIGGGGIAVQGKEYTIELKGNVKFENNQVSDIMMRYYNDKQSWLSVANLTTTSPIVMHCSKRVEFTTDTVANHPFVAVEGMAVTEVDGKLVLDVAG